jgi:hypothetical protein
MDLQGREQETVNKEAGPYSSVHINNLPAQNDKTAPADPTQPWLELYAAAMPKNTQRVQERVLMDSPQQHVSEVNVTCAAPTGNFHVNIDGAVYGPFHTIRIAALQSRGSRRSSAVEADNRIVPTRFPVQTFTRLTNI